jgi:hypothetical protein
MLRVSKVAQNPLPSSLAVIAVTSDMRIDLSDVRTVIQLLGCKLEERRTREFGRSRDRSLLWY